MKKNTQSIIIWNNVIRRHTGQNSKAKLRYFHSIFQTLWGCLLETSARKPSCRWPQSAYNWAWGCWRMLMTQTSADVCRCRRVHINWSFPVFYHLRGAYAGSKISNHQMYQLSFHLTCCKKQEQTQHSDSWQSVCVCVHACKCVCVCLRWGRELGVC